MLLMVSVEVPWLVKVTDCAELLVPTDWLAKVRESGERPMTGAVAVPVKVTFCGLPGALSLIETE